MKKFVKQLSFRLFDLVSRAGLFVLPAHYYVPLASIPKLKATKDTWAVKSDLPGINTNLDGQAETLRQTCTPYKDEYAGNATFLEAVANRFGPGYGYIEAQALHAVVRHYKPKKIIEVGSGVSTACMLAAMKLNVEETGDDSSLTCIEPYPSDALKGLGQITLISQPVQTTPLSVFESLGSGDMLFIDSSHAIKPGSDVNFLILEVLPRLAPGVIVHVHDIYFPYDYPRDVLRTYFQWMETSLLRAYMINNSHVKILFCLSQLHYDRKEVLREVFPEYSPAADVSGLEVADDAAGHFPASIFIQIV